MKANRFTKRTTLKINCYNNSSNIKCIETFTVSGFTSLNDVIKAIKNLHILDKTDKVTIFNYDTDERYLYKLNNCKTKLIKS
ncbi:MAG: hypothetical protein IAC58_02925 [Firmicutes bacterium]|uniref:Uncharacterized protein n=1 Tax=Candidatus Onthovivens merdipullorum TaxID=2840889 RepID=A0A9D9GXF4_9BACL|nr:hypothetical protein [Candidatus Onthovivens merdipullorum]